MWMYICIYLYNGENALQSWYALEREKEYVERGFIPKRASMRYSELAKRQDVQISAKVDCIILSVNGQTQSFGNCNGNGNGGSETGGRTATKGLAYS